MKSTSARTFFVFAAAMALGAAATVSACTVTSTSNPNFDGGSSSGNTSSGGTTDGGGEGGNVTTSCQGNTKQTVFFEPQACQTCFDTKCCGELNSCFGITPATPDGGTEPLADCNTYSECIDTCTRNNPSDQSARDACYGLCDDPTVTDPRVLPAYESMANCGATNCKTECGFE